MYFCIKCLKLFIVEKRKRFRKNSKKNEPILTEDDVEFLTNNTRYDEKEVREWFRCGYF